MSNNLSRLAKLYEGDTCAKFDELLARMEAEDGAEPCSIISLARAWNAGKIGLCNINPILREDVKKAALAL